MIFERGLAQSRSRAVLLLQEGSVSVNGKIVTKASFEVGDTDDITVIDSIGYVGRGGLKLQYALDRFLIDVNDKTCLDIGASTGGFTQCLLKYGASNVVAVDVGHGQMNESISSDPRVTLLENTNAKALQPEMIGGKKQIIVMDVSFISQTEIYPAMFECLEDDGCAITLVKPQFEAGSSFLNQKGIVKDKRVYYTVLNKISENARLYGFCVKDACVSSILGGDGNVEFLVLIKKGDESFDFVPLYNSVLKGEEY